VWTVRLLEPAREDLSKPDAAIARRIVRRLRWLAGNMDTIQPIRLMGDLSGFCRLREGACRIIYQVADKQRLILVHAIGHRRDIYR
jgi:mRNA interferase RelE/StbE